jgi:hypothetical protein
MIPASRRNQSIGPLKAPDDCSAGTQEAESQNYYAAAIKPLSLVMAFDST